MRSDLPGAKIELKLKTCRFSLAQAAKGLSFDYVIKIAKGAVAVVPGRLDAGVCQQPGASGLIINERIAGKKPGKVYHNLHGGLCEGIKLLPRTLTLGNHQGAMKWKGRSWFGPSDTNTKPGPFFGAGTYLLSIWAEGVHSVDGRQAKYRIESTVEITLF